MFLLVKFIYLCNYKSFIMEVVEKDKRTVKTMSVKIGKRTYFYDVKTTSNGDYYLVISESRRTPEGNYEKHKIFIYEEDFYKFSQAYEEIMGFMKQEKPDYFVERELPAKEKEEE